MESRKAHNTYVNNIIASDESGSDKRFFTYVKSRRCDSSGVSPLNHNGVSHSSSKQKAEILNNQFSSVFTKEDKGTLPSLGPSPYASIPDINITVPGISKLLSRLNPHKATGPDNIPSRLLKEAGDQLAPALTLLFNASLIQHRIPTAWSKAFITPIFKKGERSKPSNYRPVSLTCIASKILEHVLHSHIMSHLDKHNILSPYQHGFRKNRSCETQLLVTIHDLASGLKDGKQMDAILLDFSKAFDKVPHERLLLKLDHYGIRGDILDWINQFLTNRTQQVVLEGEKSSHADVTSGVPQGTVLGPLLFLLYINDLPSKASSTTRLFADDCLMYRQINNSDDARQLQADLDAMEEWERTWLMSFNPDKCEVLRITNKRLHIINTTYTIHGQPLSIVDSAKYLGVTISSKLTWKEHITTKIKKANSTRAFLQRNLRAAPIHVKTKAYNTFIRPSVEYCSTVWSPHQKDLIKKLEGVQRRSARFVMGDYRQTSSVTSMLNHLQWESLEERRLRAKLTMVYKIMSGLVAIPFATPYFLTTTSHTTI